MMLPGFLGPGTTVSLSPVVAERAAGGGGGGGSLGFVIEPQFQTNWCWAAVSKSVSEFYDHASPWTQCSIANAALPRTDCCGQGAGAACNVPWYLQTALGVTDNLRQMLSHALDEAAIRTEIAASAPIGVRVGWFGGGGHFMVVDGCLTASDGTVYIDICDPIYLNTRFALDAFAASYQGGGTWIHTYLTQASSGGGAVAVVASTRSMLSAADLESIGA